VGVQDVKELSEFKNKLLDKGHDLYVETLVVEGG